MAGDEDQYNTFLPPRNVPKPDPARRPPPKTVERPAVRDPEPRPPARPSIARAPEPSEPAGNATLPHLPVKAPPIPPPVPPTTEPSPPPPPAVTESPPRQLPPPVGPSGFALVKAVKASVTVEGVPLDPAALELLTAEQTPRQFLDAMVAAEMFADAIRYLAYLLPGREAIWWAHQCVREHDAKAPRPVLQCVATWVSQPTEETRRAAQLAAQVAGPTTPSGLTAQAVFWSGGSIAPVGAATVAPGAHLTPQAVAMALAVLVLTSPNMAERSFDVLSQGAAIANGQSRWSTG
jgi:hypothetical protein